MTRADVWTSFSHDPRLDAHAALSASDGDRAVVNRLLAEAYADGRLDRDEWPPASAAWSSG